MAGFGRYIALVVAAVLLTAGPQAGRGQTDDQTITYHGVEFPAAFADGLRFDPRNYEATSPGLGFGTGYRHRGAVSTLYIYDLQQPALPDDLDAAPVVQQFEQANGDVQRAPPAGGSLNSKTRFSIADARGRPRLNCQSYDLQRGSAEPHLDTFVCLGVVNGKFFKVRTTMPQQSGSQDELMRFIGAWVAKLWTS